MVSAYGSDLTPYDWTMTLNANNTPNNHLQFTPGTLAHKIATTPEFSRFYYLIKLGAVASLLNSFTIDYTLFVPTNSAFEQTFQPFNEDIIMNMDKYTAKELVLYHLLPMHIPLGVLESSNGMYLETKIANEIHANILYEKVSARGDNKLLMLNNMSIITGGDIKTSNGLIHIISKLLIPPAFTSTFAPYIIGG